MIGIVAVAEWCYRRSIYAVNDGGLSVGRKKGFDEGERRNLKWKKWLGCIERRVRSRRREVRGF